MRSTITLCRAGSPMRVPPSFTNSAATPSFAPSSFTRAMNAGGKLYSRPQRRPTFFIFVSCKGLVGLPRLLSTSVHRMRRRSARLGHPTPRFRNQVAHDGLHVSRFLVHAQLAVCARAFIHDGVNIFNRAPATEVVHHIIHKFQQFGNQLPHRHFLFLAEVDQLSLDSVSCRPPFVFLDQTAPVKPPAHVALVQPVQL